MLGCSLKGFCAMHEEDGMMSLLCVYTLMLRIVLFLELSHLVQHGPTNKGVSLSWMAHCSESKSDMFVGLSVQSWERGMSVSYGWDHLLEGTMTVVSRLHWGVETASSERDIWGVKVLSCIVLKPFYQPHTFIQYTGMVQGTKLSYHYTWSENSVLAWLSWPCARGIMRLGLGVRIIYLRPELSFTFIKEIKLLELHKILSHNITIEVSDLSTQIKFRDDAVWGCDILWT
jgi:hypothetical protein